MTEHIVPLIAKRSGEKKLGENVQVAGARWDDALQRSDARFVLLGIPEDIGVRANGGIAGTASLWPAALRALLNVQETAGLSGSGVLLLGAFNFSSLSVSDNADQQALCDAVRVVDQAVSEVIERVAAAAKIPVVIGGGHNNAYPILRGMSRALGMAMSCINLDAHSDFRRMEGRHSGNGFRYAMHDGHLERYAMVALHENYNVPGIMDELQAGNAFHFTTYEDIFIRRQITFDDAVAAALGHCRGLQTGVELDIDSIEGALASAATPCGVSTLQARQYVYACALSGQAAYFHMAEGAIALADGRSDPFTAKLVSYLVTDFIRGVGGKPNL